MTTAAPLTVLVTGVNGFVGQHLARALTSAGHRVVGLGRDPEPSETGELSEYVRLDLADVDDDLVLPDHDHVVHLASLSAVGPSFDDPLRYYAVNGRAAHAVLSEHLRRGRQGRVVVVSTGAVYAPDGSTAVSEDTPVGHGSPYVVSKLHVEDITRYHAARGVDAVVVRPMNHIGPGQGRGFLVPDLLGQLRGASADGEVVVGDLTTRRDYTDVRDVVAAYLAIIEAPTLAHRLYNVCSGTDVAGTEILDGLVHALGIDPPRVVVDPQRVRPTDLRSVRGTSERLTSDTGWRPLIPLQQTLADAVAAGDR